MPGPENAIYIVVGEMSMVMTAMRRTSRWSSHSHQEEEQDSLLRNMSNLKEILNHINDLSDLEPTVFLSPFLDVIRSENIPAPITGHALSAIHKFLSYGLVDSKYESAAVAVENIADAVTHARFVGTDQGTDEIVLMKILQVLRMLLLTPVGMLLSDDSVCEIMQSCFRLCFETRLSELLRKSAEHSLIDMVQLLFSRLPQFSEDSKWIATRKLHMKAIGIDSSRNSYRRRLHIKHKKINQTNKLDTNVQNSFSNVTSPDDSGCVSSISSPETFSDQKMNNESFEQDIQNYQESSSQEEILENKCNAADSQCNIDRSKREISLYMHDDDTNRKSSLSQSETSENAVFEKECDISQQSENQEMKNESNSITEIYDLNIKSDNNRINSHRDSEYVNPHGVRFTAQQIPQEGSGPLIPYGLPCVRELFRFLVTLINPIERHNTEANFHIGLSLLTVALEAGANQIDNFNSLLTLIKDDMCRNLFSLLLTEKLSIFAAVLRVCFLLFESLRTHIKFQLEMYLTRLIEIIISESLKVPYEQREIALDSISQLWHIPGLVTELYLNFDCSLYCSNLFEDLTKLLSKNAFPVSGLYSTHLLSLDALLAVIDSIESHCHFRILNGSQLEIEIKKNTKNTYQEIENGQDEKENEDLPIITNHSGYLLGQLAISGKLNKSTKLKGTKIDFQFSCGRRKLADNIPNHKEITDIKNKKKLLAVGTEQFNNQPSKGITFLQEHGLLKDPLNPSEVALFLRDNPQLDKRMIGEYLSNRKNLKVLEAFVRSFTFEDLRIDEALRQYLETFRLPGEAPLISLLLEHFAEHWHKSNSEPFHNNDAAFTLAYAIIMLNVDQHNHNVKKQNNPMTVEEFKKNLKGVNGGQDFDEEMLEEIYVSIRNEEIVMPAEQSGLVRENYLWKVLLRRGSGKEGSFIHTPDGVFDHDLFSLIWGPTVAALSYVFDKSTEATIIQKSISGFRKCAMISAHYGMSDVFDNLVISLCKFTTLLSSESSEHFSIVFGSNSKALLACRTLFNLAHRHGDILREGWKNLLDCVLQLYRMKLLPVEMMEAEDFVNPNGIISLIQEETSTIQRSESGLLSSFYSYITQTADNQVQRGPTPEDEAAKQSAQNCINDCHPEQLITESKFLRVDSLQELVKTLIYSCHGTDSPISLGNCYEESTVFLTELLIKIALQNRDRITTIWPGIRDHLYSLIMEAAAGEQYFLLERGVVGILRIVIRMARREELIPQVLHSLKMLLLLKSPTLLFVSSQIVCALYELLHSNGGNIHSSEDWSIIFMLLECAGAGSKPPRSLHITSDLTSGDTGAQSDGELNTGHEEMYNVDRGYTSDSELYDKQGTSGPPRHYKINPENINNATGWILVNKEGEVESVPIRPLPVNQYNIVLEQELLPHDPFAFTKACECIAFLIRDAAHITMENFESCVHCLRVYIEASMNGGYNLEKRLSRNKNTKEKRLVRSSKWKDDSSHIRRTRSSPRHSGNGNQQDDDKMDLLPLYQQISIQLLDLMHTLHTRAASIFNSWLEEKSKDNRDAEVGNQKNDAVIQIDGGLWTTCWCPLLQGIARLCCDTRRSIRTSALTYLQRALLVHDLQVLSAVEWEACFNKVLFPLLAKLLENINPQDPMGMEETRMRGATLLCKVFLQHLNPLLSLPTFTALWLTILDFMDKYMHVDGCDLLNEAIPESLKNMLLVMDTAGIFYHTNDSNGLNEGHLWHITWDRINTFLPNLKKEVFKPNSSISSFQFQSLDEGKSSDKVDVLNNVETKQDSVDLPLTKKHQSLHSLKSSSEKVDLEENLNANSPLTTSHQTTPSVILHPPAFTFTHASSYLHPVTTHPLNATNNGVQSTNVKSSAVPLLLNPSVMEQTTVPIFSPQPSKERNGSPR
ncbi:Golgi-specific brefeldin A-resistance guanine nucleotide exchange factor 1 [Centruroides vittatus]|uniref:Golgi-specific brefeldin A-resistance guanine nucleotide exchange factor 1 n=1 Tax=Centruroides vittatus TaxID=120091 RepID=UPI00350F5FE4